MRKILVSIIAATVLVALGSSAALASSDIVFISDFGHISDSVAQCKAVIYKTDPNIKITDMTHGIEPFDVLLAAFLLSDSAPLWPKGTVFLAVVDPGAGTSRKRLAIKTKEGQYFVGPDNGVFTMVARVHGIEKAVYLENQKYMRTPVSPTFEGRDVFAPVAAILAGNGAAIDDLGPEAKTLKHLDWELPQFSGDTLSGAMLFVEKPFGNVWTDITRTVFAKTGMIMGNYLRLNIDGGTIVMPLTTTYGEVPVGAPLAYFNSRDLLSFAINQGSFSGITPMYQGKKISIDINPTDLVDVMELSTGNIKLDIRYATKNNFTGKKVYPSGKCILRRDAAMSLVKASELARKESKPFSICVLDCYRPLSVQKAFWAIKPDPRYVADPAKGSNHNRAMAVDVTACNADGRELEMPTKFDDFSEKAHRDNIDTGTTAGRNYKSLEKVMTGSGFSPFSTEWWHYDFPGVEDEPILDIPMPN